MKKSVFRLITICAALALLCAATLCFSLPSAAENLLTDSWAALDDTQSAYVSYTGGVLSIDAATPGVDVKAYQTLDLGAGSYKLSVTKSSNDLSFTVQYPGGEASEVKYDEGYVDFTMASAGEVTIIAFQYRGILGTASNMTLVSVGGSSESSQGGQDVTEPVVTEPVASQPQGGSTLTDNWVALDDSQAAAVSCSGGVLSINAGLVEGDVKAGQTLNLAAGTYTLTATKGGDPMSFSAKWPGNEVGETEGTLTFTLTAATEVQIIAYQYRGTSGTASNIVLSGGSVQPTTPVSSETTPSASTPSETQPSQQGGSTLTDNWVALDDSQSAAVSCSGGVLTINAGLVEGDVKAGQTLNLAAGTYTLTATKGGDPMSFSAKWPGNEVGETEGKLTFTLTSATEVQIIAYQYRGTSGTASNIVLSGGSQPSSIVTDPVSSETQPVVTDPSTPSGGTNLIVNGAFNNGMSGWTPTNLDANSAKVVEGQLVINMPGAWHASVLASINGTIKPNTQYTLKYEATGVTNLQVAVHLAPGFGGGATMIAQPGETTFTTAADLTSADFYVQIEGIADGDVAGTFDNFVLVEGTNTDVTEPSVNPTQPGTNPTSVNPGQTGKVVVWSGTIARDFSTRNTVAIISVDELTQAFRSDLAANGVPTKYEIEAVASYTSGPSGYACWGFYQDSPYLEAWSDKGGTLTSSVFTNSADLSKLTNGASVCLFSEGSGDITNVQSLTLYAYREGGTTESSSIVTDPTQPIVTDPIVTDPIVTDPIVTDPIVTDPIVTDPTQPTDGKVLVWAGNLNADYTTVNGVAPINDQTMMMAVVGELMTNGIPEQVEVKSALTYLGGDSGFAAIGLYSNGQVIWPDDGCPIDDVTFSNLQGLGADTALVVFSYGTDTVHIDNMEIYVKRAQAVVTDPTATGTEEVNPGDANGDGAINMKDVLALRKLLADMPTGDFNEANADVNGDGSVNMKDVLALRKMLAN